MTGTSDDRAAVSWLIWSHIVSRSVHAVAELRVVDAMEPETVTPVEEIAARVDVQPDPLRRVLRVLAGEGLFVEDPPRSFRTTPRGELLRDGDASLRYIALVHSYSQKFWADAVASMRTGVPAPILQTGRSRWELLAEAPEEAAAFNRAMRSGAAERLTPLFELDWTNVATVVDVGGGSGGVVLALLEREPHLTGTILDLPHVRADAEAAIAAAGLERRCTFAAGSFFDRVPEGADVYIVSQILHDWSDDETLAILRTCRAAVPPAGRLAIAERLLAEGNERDFTKLVDLHMLFMLGGRERTVTEFEALFAATGFALERVTPGPLISVLEARPV
jgi:SAM-dependent methyltransferase